MATPKTFQWGAGGTKLTPADVARNRSLAAALLAKKGKPQNVTQGINRFSEALLHNVLNKRASKAETSGRATATDMMAKMMGGGDGPIQLPTGGGPASSGSYSDGLSKTESGSNYGIVNDEGYGGKYQFGDAKLTDYNKATGNNITMEQFLKSPKIQEAAQDWNVSDTDSFITANNLNDYVGQNIGGVNMTQNGMRAVAHLGGKDGMMKFLQSGGKYNPSDSNGTSLLDYARTHGGAPQNPVQMAQAQAPQRSGINPQIMQLLNNQWASPAQKSVAQMLMKQGMGRQKLQEQRGYDAGLLTDANIRDDRLSDEKRTNVAKLLAASQTREDMLRKEGRDFDLANPKPTTAQSNFEYSNANPGFTEWQNANKKAGATSVTVNGEPADGNLRKALDKNTGEQWGAYQKKGAESAAMAQDMQILDELITIAPQGPITGRLAEMFPGFSSAGDAFQSIVKRLAPQLRVEGSGSTSDIEYAGMLRGMPALQNKPEANALIAGIMKAKASINVERSGIVNDYARGDISAAFARKKMSELNKRSIMTPEMHKMLTGVGGVSDPLKATNDPTKPSSEEEYNAIPSGELFVDPDDGKTYRKP